MTGVQTCALPISVRQMDHVRPSDLDIFLKTSGMTEQAVMDLVEPMRDHSIWTKNSQGEWETNDSVVNHEDDEGVDAVRMPLNPDTPVIKPTKEKISRHSQTFNEQTEYVLL